MWSKPLVQIADEFKVGSHVLKRLCKSHNIPLPKLGHWQRVKHGKTVVKLDLPKMEDETVIEFYIPGIQGRQAIVFKDDFQKRVYELKMDKTLDFHILSKLLSPHPLIVKTKIELEKWEGKKKFSRYSAYDREQDILPIHTDSKLRPRALRFMNTLVLIVEKLGYCISFEYGRCHVEMFGQKTEIHLRQKFNRVREDNGRGYSMESWVKTDKLEFQAGPSHDLKNWIDKKTKVLEEYLPEVVAWIEKDCEYWHDLRAQQAEERKKREQEQLEKQKAERALADKQAKFNQLIVDTENWVKANQIREYIKELELKCEANQKYSESVKAYIGWANKKVDGLDPLCSLDELF